MKKQLVFFLLLLIANSIFAFEKVREVAYKPSYYSDLLKHLNFSCRDVYDLNYFVGDTITIQYANTKGLAEASYYSSYSTSESESEQQLSQKAFSLLTPDTIWIKQSKKPKEGKHYLVFHQYKASYHMDGKRAIVDDTTPIESIIGHQFVVDEIMPSAAILTSMSDGVKIKLHLSFLNEYYLFKSNKLAREMHRILGRKLYTQKSGFYTKYTKQYNIYTVTGIKSFVFFNGNVKINLAITPSLSRGAELVTQDQYRKDSLLTAEYNKRYEINYYVTPNIKYDEDKLGHITDYKHSGRVGILAKTHSCSVGQAIYQGRFEKTSYIEDGTCITIAGVDTILDKVYYKAIDGRKVFYIEEKNVYFIWDSYFFNDHTDETAYINALRTSSKDVQDAFFEYTKSREYELYLDDIETIHKFEKQYAKYGIFMEKCKPYQDYSTVGLEFNIVNYSKKTIKYIELTTTAYNSVMDPVSTKTVKGIGPVYPGDKAEFDFENVWYSSIIATHRPKSIVITYMDNTKTTIKANDIDKITPDLDYSSALDNIDAYSNLKSGLYDPQTGKYSEYPRP